MHRGVMSKLRPGRLALTGLLVASATGCSAFQRTNPQGMDVRKATEVPAPLTQEHLPSLLMRIEADPTVPEAEKIALDTYLRACVTDREFLNRMGAALRR